MSDKTFITEKEVASELRLSAATLRAWRTRSFGPPWVKAGSRVLYRREALGSIQCGPGEKRTKAERKRKNMAEINTEGGGEEMVCKTFIYRFDSGPRLHPTLTNQNTSTEVSANAPGVNRDRYLATFGDVPDENRTAPCFDCGGETDQITATRVPDGGIACPTCADFFGKCCLCGGRWPHADLDFVEEDIHGVDHFVCRACSGLRPELPAPVPYLSDGRATSEDDDEFLRSTRKYVEADYCRAWAERYPSTARLYLEAYEQMRPIRKVVRCA